MAKKKTVAELRAENQQLRSAGNVAAWASVLNNLVRWGGVSFCFYCLYLMVDALAGEVTYANIVIQFLGSLTVSKAFAYLLGAGGVGWGVVERRIRKRNTEHLHSRVKQLEKKLDARRSSSNLTKQGDTNPADKE